MAIHPPPMQVPRCCTALCRQHVAKTGVAAQHYCCFTATSIVHTLISQLPSLIGRCRYGSCRQRWQSCGGGCRWPPLSAAMPRPTLPHSRCHSKL